MLIFESSLMETNLSTCCGKPKPHKEHLEDEMCCVEIEAREPGGTRREGKEATLEVWLLPHVILEDSESQNSQTIQL